VKYYERNTNYWSEPGLSGKSSILWNTKMTANGKRSELLNSSAWRAFPKVSINTFLQNRGDGKYLLISQGSDSSVPTSVYLHNSVDLINWSNESILVFLGIRNNDTKDALCKNYPTLIGDSGQSSLTTEHNMFYYQRDVIDNDAMVSQDLCRKTLTLEK
jgi:hypothetical protein